MEDKAKIDQEIAEELQRMIGKPVQYVRALAEVSGWLFRVTCTDGRHRAVTRDYAPFRINAHVENGLVVHVDRG